MNGKSVGNQLLYKPFILLKARSPRAPKDKKYIFVMEHLFREAYQFYYLGTPDKLEVLYYETLEGYFTDVLDDEI